jgi:DNA processing protein
MATEMKVNDFAGILTPQEVRHAPDLLYMEGDISLLTMGARVSVVGSRKASEAGQKRAYLFTKYLVEAGITVVSGLAEGIDTIAHRAAIDLGGKTIAVLGTPLDKVYPKSNAGLIQEIKANHLAVSQFSRGYPSRAENFPRRNRTMALISDATVIIEASEKSGTRHQGWEALRIGRTLFILDSVASDNSLSWPSEMIKYGAIVIDNDNIEDALAELPIYTGSVDFGF